MVPNLKDLFLFFTLFWIILFITIILYLKLRNSRVIQLLNKIPTADRNFIWGHAMTFMIPREDWFKTACKLTSRFVPITVIWVGRSPRVSLMRARAAEKLLSSMRDLEKMDEYKFITPWLGYGLLTSTGTKWHSRRKLITPTFHFRILEDFLCIINEQAEVLVSLLKNQQDNVAFNICPYLTRCTLDVICETAMGKSVNVQTNTGSEYFKAINSTAEIFFYRCMRPWLRPEWLFQLSSHGKQQKKNLEILHGFTNEVIRERRELNKHESTFKMDFTKLSESDIVGKKCRLAFLDMLINYSANGEKLSDDDIREEVDTFMFEGHDTTSSGLCWILFNLGRFPEIQKKVHEELDWILGDSNRAITTNDLAEMKYLERVIKESMRLFPPVPLYGRKLSEDLEICGYLIPGGVSVSVNVFTLHRDPEFFPDPETFDPDRFLPENCAKRHPYAYIPFSAGPRNCIGQKFALMEEKVIVALILRHFHVTSVQKLEDIKLMAELILRPANGIWIKLQCRN